MDMTAKNLAHLSLARLVALATDLAVPATWRALPLRARRRFLVDQVAEIYRRLDAGLGASR